MKDILYRVFIGLVFGFANIIPGVSGGTAMMVFGVYERIIGFITDFKNRFKDDWRFFLPIVIGMGISILVFGKLMDSLLTQHESLTRMFFIGVIVFSVPMILKLALGKKKKKRKIKKDIICLVCFLVVLGLMIGMAVLNNQTDKEAIKAAAAETGDAGHGIGHILLMVVYGAIACATMIIPGISGSLTMVILGVYDDIIAAVASLDFALLLPFAAGCALGLIFCAKLIKWLLKKYPRQTYSAILGFVVGSILPIFPGFSYIFSSVAPWIAFLIGGACIIACDKLAPEAK